jgi:hypothetical protein
MAGRDGTGDVIDLRSRRGYVPDLRRLACGQVAAARGKLGLDLEAYAEHLGAVLGWSPGVDLLESWETTVVPPGDVLLAAAMSLQDVPGEVLTFPLSPGAERTADLLAAIGPAIGQTLDADVVGSYATRGEVGRTQWNDVITGAAEHLWLYGMAEAGYARDDAVPGIVGKAVEAGCDVRVLLLDPEYERMLEIDEDERSPAGTLGSRIHVALHQFELMRDEIGPGVQIRVYNAHPSVSVVRGDDRMLVTPYVRYFTGGNSPTFELQGGSTGRMFERYGRHFENTWARARDWTT